MLARSRIFRIARISIAIVLFVLGTPVLLLMTLGQALVIPSQVTLENSYLDDFRGVAAYAQQFQRRAGRLPAKKEFQDWAKHQGVSIANFGDLFIIDTNRCLVDDGRGFIKPARDAFVIGRWVGESTECYSVPSGKTTLKLTAGAVFEDGFTFTCEALGAGILLVFLGWFAWPPQGTAKVAR